MVDFVTLSLMKPISFGNTPLKITVVSITRFDGSPCGRGGRGRPSASFSLSEPKSGLRKRMREW